MIAVRIAVAIIRIYQHTLSHVFGRCCRFYPSCSAYAAEAIESHGLIQGLWLGTKRVCKCHPFHPGGVDPVPVDRGCEAADPSEGRARP